MVLGMFSWRQAVVLLWLLPLLHADTEVSPYDPDVNLNTPQTIRRHGYPAEAHTVQTADGYILTMHRIPGGRARDGEAEDDAPGARVGIPPGPTPRPRRRPVLLHHGLMGSSYAWILAGPGRGLAYLLADAGYDVWMANARGNIYSRAHASLPTYSSSPFWDFSFHEVGVYDLPAEMEYILRATGASQLHYVGHSMGTTALFALAAARPRAAARVASAFALAPVVFVRHVKSPIRLLAPFARDAEYLAHLLGKGELLPHSKILKHLAKYGCELLPIDKTLCENMVFIICGYDAAQFDKALLPVMLSHSAQGASTKTAIHYAQMINSGKFQQFDYGAQENMKRYNSTAPPSYDLSKINVSTHLYYAANDWLASVMDVNSLYTDLQCKKSKYLVPLPTFNHLDFILAKDVKKLLYDDIIKQLQQEDNGFLESQ
ncbi:Lipase 3, partial [Gryllus bimaculatus]